MTPYLLLFLLCMQGSLGLWTNEWIIGEACSDSALISFDKCSPQDYVCLCGSQNFLATVALCISERANTSATSRDEAWDHFTYSKCEIHDAAVSDQDYKNAISYLNQTTVKPMPQTQGSSSSSSKKGWGNADYPDIAHPVAIPDDVYEVAHRSVYEHLHNKDVGVWQGAFLVGYWVFIFMFVALVRLKRWVSARYIGPSTHMHRPGKLYRWYQQYILVPALFGGRHMTRINVGLGINLSMPTRFETIVIAIYFILNVIFDCAPYTFLVKNPLYPTHWKQMVLYLGDRSGIIGVVQLPLLTLFATRNNFIIAMTGWSFATFNTYHRAVVRITYCQFIVHSVAKHVFALSYGGSLVKSFYPVPYYRYGVAGMFLMAIMIASGHIRQNHYELFLRLHIPAAIGSYLMILYHLNGLGYKQTVYVSFGIWCADWCIRVFRLVFNNVALYFPPVSRSGRLTRATLSITGDNDCAKINVRTPVLWRASPGQYVFIHLSRFHFWEAHPFSVLGPSEDGESFQLFCRKRGGMTQKLVNRLLQCEEMNMSVLVEGPYGVHSPVERYTNVLLIAGGVGVTGVLPYVEYLCDIFGSPDCATTHITFVWTVATVADTAWIHDRLTTLFRSRRVDIQIYVGKGINRPKSILGHLRRPSQTVQKMKQRFSVARRSRDFNDNVSPFSSYGSNSSSTQSIVEKSSKPDIQVSTAKISTRQEPTTFEEPTLETDPEFEHVPLEKSSEWYYLLKTGRPKLSVVVDDFVYGAEGSVAILTCGPPGLMDSLRHEVTCNINKAASGRVDYFEEAFMW